ncbi:MAG: hypothetical protein WKF60_12725, partial [Ilumatobacter sp.]
GVYWDDAWHTDRGRDDLLSAPHLALYVGVTVAVGVVAWWGWTRRRVGWRRVAAGPTGVAIVGAAVTLGSAPVDEWWHTTFGRDAVLWSPPHLVALVGTVALGSGVALVTGQSRPAQGSRVGIVLVVATGAGVLGAWQVLVLEYDTDVAQFTTLWYLPVLAVGLTAASATVHGATSHRVRWAAGWAGVAYTLAMITVIAILSATGFSTPIVPAVLPALFVADLARRRAWSIPVRAAAIVVALFVVEVPYLRWVDGGVAPSTPEALWGAAIAAVGVAVTLAIFDPTNQRIPPLTPTTVLVLIVATAGPLMLVGGRAADAHDPGQGTGIAAVTLTADVSDTRVELTAATDDSDQDLEPVRTVARRAGRLTVGPLSEVGNVWSGTVDLDEHGRWFVYVELRRGAERLEAWLPVVAGSNETVTKQTELYVRRPDNGATTNQIIAGLVLVLVALGVIGRVAATVRAANSRPDYPRRSAGRGDARCSARSS